MGRGLIRSRSKSRMTAVEKRSDNRKRSLSKLRQKMEADEGNWEESDDEYSEEPYEIEAESIQEESVVDRYKMASKFVNKALDAVIEGCVEGASVSELCLLGDKIMEEECSKVFVKPNEDGDKVFKGVAFPTSVSMNDFAAHYAPHAKEESGRKLKSGDVTKIHMGCHIDGYISQVVHTIVVGDVGDAHEQAQDVIEAAYKAAEIASRVMRPDLNNNNEAVTNMFQRVASDYGVQTCEGVLSHRVLRWNALGPACIVSVRISHRDEQFQEVEPVTFGPNEVWTLDVVMSTGHKQLHCSEEPTTIWKRNDIMLAPKTRSAHYVLKSVREKLLSFPFSTAHFENLPMAKMGLKDLQHMDMVDPIPVMKTKKRDVVARFSWTMMLTPQGIVRLTGLPLPENINSAKSVKDAACMSIAKASLLAPSHPKRVKRNRTAAKKRKTEDAMDAD
eukprot:TRINITY_DN78_c0_g2_i1.p1 TRINITY_DN78_c0_g2~~TRINITY_DN78_c0_g2_i1.p1  ORF type:complete len:465 (+),score=102.78 TRINITY_DN78_c0_g2_i1:58-1395(+)